MDDKKVKEIVVKAAKLLFDYPEMTHKQAIKKAKGMILGENPNFYYCMASKIIFIHIF